MLELEPFNALALSLHYSPGVQALLIGSGLSRAAGIPTGWEITLDLVRRLGALNGVTEHDDWAAWFHERYSKAPGYSDVLNMLAETASERRTVLHGYIEPRKGENDRRPTKAHRAIAKLVADGAVRVIITTNFDRLIENALRDAAIEPTVIASEDALAGAVPLVHARCTVIKLHGDYLDSRIKNTDAELAAYAPVVDSLLDEIFDRYGLTVVGWSGEWIAALRAALLRAPSRRYPFYWAARGDISPQAQGLVTHRGGRVIPIADADSFFVRLTDSLEALRQAARPHPLSVEMAVALAKRYCRDDRYALEWVEFLADEIAKIRSFVTGAEYPTGGLDAANLNTVITRVVARSEMLRRACMVSGRWGTPEANRATARAIRTLSLLSESQGGVMVLTELRRFAATLCFYWVLAGALAREDFETVRTFMHTKTKTRGDDVALVTALPPVALTSLEWKFLTGFERLKLPASEFLFNLLKQEAADISVDPTDSEELFNQLELLVSLEFMRFKLQVGDKDWLWAPFGRYLWSRAGDGVVKKLSDLENLPATHPVIKAELLGIGPADATKTVQALQKLIRENPSLRY